MTTTTFKVLEVAQSGNTHVVEAHSNGLQPFPIHWCQSEAQADAIAAQLNAVLANNELFNG